MPPVVYGRILLIDGQPLFSEGLRSALGDGLVVVGLASSGEQGLLKAAELRPSLVVADCHIDGFEGTRLIRKLRTELPQVRVLAVGNGDEPDRSLVDIVRAGAVGFISRNQPVQMILDAIAAVSNGSVFLGPLAVASLMRAVTIFGADDLTSRERQIIECICQGKGSKDIALELDLQLSSVQTYRKRIFRKLGVRSAVELVRYAALNRS